MNKLRDYLPSGDSRQELLTDEVRASSIVRWQPVGICAMDTAQLLITDPCYTLGHQTDTRNDPPEFTYKDCCGSYDPQDLPPHAIDARQLRFQRGHAGAGMVVHSPHGDGTVSVWAKLDAKNRVRAVFFSFDGEEPPRDCLHTPFGTISEKVKTASKKTISSHVKIALHQLDHGNPTEAVEALNAALALDPDLDTRKSIEKARDEADIGSPFKAQDLLELLLDDLCKTTI